MMALIAACHLNYSMEYGCGKAIIINDHLGKLHVYYAWANAITNELHPDMLQSVKKPIFFFTIIAPIDMHAVVRQALT